MTPSAPRPSAVRPSRADGPGTGPDALLTELTALADDVSALLARIGVPPEAEQGGATEATPA